MDLRIPAYNFVLLTAVEADEYTGASLWANKNVEEILKTKAIINRFECIHKITELKTNAQHCVYALIHICLDECLNPIERII